MDVGVTSAPTSVGMCNVGAQQEKAGRSVRLRPKAEARLQDFVEKCAMHHEEHIERAQ